MFIWTRVQMFFDYGVPLGIHFFITKKKFDNDSLYFRRAIWKIVGQFLLLWSHIFATKFKTIISSIDRNILIVSFYLTFISIQIFLFRIVRYFSLLEFFIYYFELILHHVDIDISH